MSQVSRLNHLEHALGRELFELLISSDHTAAVRDFAQALLEGELSKLLPTFFDTDEEAVRALVGAERYESAEATRIVVVWRRLVTLHGYKGPVLARQPVGFTLKTHAPKAGSCWQGFNYLQGWNFEDTPTPDSLVFWIPRHLRHSIRKAAEDQLRLLTACRGLYRLPEHHLSGFGTVAQQAALILAHFKRTGERVPLQRLWIRTDTRSGSVNRLVLGDFGGGGLNCYGHWDGGASAFVGVFPLGVETL